MIKDLKFEVDQEVLQKKANEFAEAAFIEELKDYYNSWNGPFRKGLKEKFQSMEFSCHFELPDILQTINNAVTKEHEEIVKNFIDSTVLVDLRNSLSLQPKEIMFSDFLKGVMEADYNYSDDYSEDYSVEYEIESDNVICKVELYYKDEKMEIRLHQFSGEPGFKFVSHPYIQNGAQGVMNRIQAYILSLLISGTKIMNFDIDSFNELFYRD